MAFLFESHGAAGDARIVGGVKPRVGRNGLERFAETVPERHGSRAALSEIPRAVDQGGRRNNAILLRTVPAEENILSCRERLGGGAGFAALPAVAGEGG